MTEEGKVSPDAPLDPGKEGEFSGKRESEGRERRSEDPVRGCACVSVAPKRG